MNLSRLKNFNIVIFLFILAASLIMIYFFIAYFGKYISYRYELVTYRQRLIDRLTEVETIKPSYNSGDPYLGNLNSKIIIFEYGDLSCEACKEIQPVLAELINFYGINNLAIIWKDFPVDPAPENFAAHNAAHCAAEQSQFFQFTDLLYQNQDKFSPDLYTEIAKRLGMNEETFNQCVEEKRYNYLVQQNFRDGINSGIDGSPTLFVNNVEMASGFNLNNLRSTVEKTK